MQRLEVSCAVRHIYIYIYIYIYVCSRLRVKETRPITRLSKNLKIILKSIFLIVQSTTHRTRTKLWWKETDWWKRKYSLRYKPHSLPLWPKQTPHPSNTVQRITTEAWYGVVNVKEIKDNQLQTSTGTYGSKNLKLPEFVDIQHMDVARMSALGTSGLYLPKDIPGTHFC
jgi:hypothetical protein